MANSIFERLNTLVGTWTTEATHPMMPGVVVHGTSTFEWADGDRFLIQRIRTDHPDFPNSISIIGDTGHDRVEESERDIGGFVGGTHLQMHYFDSRGVFRALEVMIDEHAWRLQRDSPGFSQRFKGMFSDGGDTIIGQWQLCRDDGHWNDDLAITFRRDRSGSHMRIQL